MRLLLLSNSRATDGTYLQWPRQHIGDFLGARVASVLFIPYAGVPATATANHDYALRVRAAFGALGYGLNSVHDVADQARAVERAEAIVVGGGNTFHLLAQMYGNGILDAVASAVRAGVPYVGWSAGANLACPTISTTNDMPIVEPRSLRALGLVPFQINAHFTDALPAGHQGETRSERIAEFHALNPHMPVVGLREGALLRVENGTTRLFGTGARVFLAGQPSFELAGDTELRLPG